MATNSFSIPLPGGLPELSNRRRIGRCATEHHPDRGTSRRERSTRI